MQTGDKNLDIASINSATTVFNQVPEVHVIPARMECRSCKASTWSIQFCNCIDVKFTLFFYEPQMILGFDSANNMG